MHVLNVEQQFCTQAVHWSLQYLFVFPAPQSQGSCALTPGRGAIHLRCGLQLSTVNEDVALMLVISSPALNA